MDRVRFPDIDASAFVSDADRRALDALKAIPLLPTVVSKFYELGLDRWMYVHNMANNVRCGPKQFSTLYEMLRESCDVLDMPEPELYVTNHPMSNAFAGGVERPYITLRNSMIENLSDEQLYHLIGHELGHIKAGHVLYFSVAAVLIQLLEAIGRRTFGLGDVASLGLIMAFYEWSRQAEFSADRAGLLVSQSIETSLGAELALAGGTHRFKGESNLEAFMDQARAYQDASPADQIGKAIWFLLYGYQSTHPVAVLRAQHMERWHQSGDYEKILAGDYAKVKKAS